jgi:hypothetical protein
MDLGGVGSVIPSAGTSLDFDRHPKDPMKKVEQWILCVPLEFETDLQNIVDDLNRPRPIRKSAGTRPSMCVSSAWFVMPTINGSRGARPNSDWPHKNVNAVLEISS